MLRILPTTIVTAFLTAALALPVYASPIDAQVAAIDAAPLTERERMVDRVATEGAAVDGYFDDFQCRKITVEMLLESGRSYRTMYFVNGTPIRVHAVDLKYPNHTMFDALPHEDFSIEKGDTVIADEIYDFAGNRLTAFQSSLKDADDKDAPERLAEAKAYLRFIQMPLPEGQQEENVSWACQGSDNNICTGFTNEPDKQ